MRGAVNWNAVALIMVALALIFSVAAYIGGIKVQIQQAAPAVQPPEKAEMVNVKIWDVLARVYDSDTNAYIPEANIYLLYEKPKNIYVTPSSGIVAAELNVPGRATFTGVDTDRTYFVLAAAPGYYNGGTEFTLPDKLPETQVSNGQPYVVDIYLDPKGTILGVQVPLAYRGSSADIAKLVYNADNDDYETEFSFVASTDGVIKYKKIVIDLNTDNLGSATIDTMIVTVGDQDFEFDNVTGAKTIKFDTEQVLAAGSTLPIKMVLQGTGLDSVSGTLFTVTLYDVQEGNWMATVEGPA